MFQMQSIPDPFLCLTILLFYINCYKVFKVFDNYRIFHINSQLKHNKL